MDDVLERLSTNGFIRIPIAASVQRLIDSMVIAAFTFFRLPEKDKLASNLPEDCGYRPMGIEYSQLSAGPDAIESFTASMRTLACGDVLPNTYANCLHALMIEAIEQLESAAENLVCDIAVGISHRDEHIRMIRGSLHRWSCLQLNYSRPADSVNPFINDTHEDGHLLTMVQTYGAGLEVMAPDSSYAPIETRAGEILVMPGKTLWLLSGGGVNPLYHRVRRHIELPERISMLFFADMDPKACQPWVQNDISTSEDIGAHVLSNGSRFGLVGFGPE